jgi:protein-export membrane protein SecD
LIVQFDAPPSDTNAPALAQQVLARRINQFGTKSFFERISSNEFRISVPTTASNNIAALTKLLSARGLLEFRLVHESSERLIYEGKQHLQPDYEILTEIRTVARPAKFQNFTTNPKIVQTTESFAVPYLVKKSPELSGSHIKSAYPTRDPVSRQPKVALDFDKEGSAAFAKITAANVGRQLAIVFDGKIMSAPRIVQQIKGGSAVIEGGFSIQDAVALATLLQNPAPFPLTARLEKVF